MKKSVTDLLSGVGIPNLAASTALKILVVGNSTDGPSPLPQSDPYDQKLGEWLRERTGREVSIVNLSSEGVGNDYILRALGLSIKKVSPDLILINFAPGGRKEYLGVTGEYLRFDPKDPSPEADPTRQELKSRLSFLHNESAAKFEFVRNVLAVKATVGPIPWLCTGSSIEEASLLRGYLDTECVVGVIPQHKSPVELNSELFERYRYGIEHSKFLAGLQKQATSQIQSGATRNMTGENLVFIVGAPRSGTTWLQRVLATHPLISSGQESHLFNLFIGNQLRTWRKFLKDRKSLRGGLGLGCYLTDQEFVSKLTAYTYSLLDSVISTLPPGGLFLEKTPPHAQFIYEIHELLPKCKIIHMVRDPMDVISSMLRSAKGWGASWAPRTVSAAAKRWVDTVSHVDKFHTEFPEHSFLEVRYESLFNSPIEEVGRIANFLGLTWKRTEIESALNSNSAENIRNGSGTSLQIGGEIRKLTGATNVIEPEGFIGDVIPGSWRRRLTLTQKTLARLKIGRARGLKGYR